MLLLTTPGSRRLVGAAGVVVVVLLALFTYRGALGLPLGSDARFLTTQNAWVRDPGGLSRFWTADYFEGAITHGVPYLSGYYRPVTNTLFWLEYRVARDRDRWYRVTQVLLHALTAVLVFAVCRRVSGDRLAAAAGALVFLVHPVHAFAATDPAARADVLFPVFYLLAMLAFDAALRAGGRRAVAGWLGLTGALYLAALLSKEMGITLPAVLALLVVYRHHQHAIPLRRLAWTVPLWLLGGAYLVWRFAVLQLETHHLGYGDVYGPWVLALGALKSVVIHLSRVAVPLGAGYPELNPRLVNWTGGPLADPLTYAGVAVVGALVAMALLWRRSPLLAFWSGFFLLTFSPLLRVENIAGTMGHNIILTQERWIYLPAVAPLAVAGWGLARLARAVARPASRLALAAVTGTLLLLLARSAAVHARSYDDPFAQLRRLYLFPEKRLNRVQLANKLLLYAQWVASPMGDLTEAEARARRAVDLLPDSPIPAAALGNILVQAGQWREAANVLNPWLAPTAAQLQAFGASNPRVGDDLNRTRALIPFLLARSYGHLGDGPRAVHLLCEAARRDFDHLMVTDALREIHTLTGTPPGPSPASSVDAVCAEGA